MSAGDMSDDLVFYTNPASRGRIARWMLEEVGAPYRIEYMDYGRMKDATYLAINPMGKVPALVHKGQVVTECAAICAYLADAFPEAGLAPPVTERARYYRWLFFAAGPTEAAITNKALKLEIPKERQAMVGYGTFESMLDALEGALDGRDYIASDRFTAADLYVGSQLGFGIQFGTIERRPTFVAYLKRLHQRPAFQRASAADNAAMATPAED